MGGTENTNIWGGTENTNIQGGTENYALYIGIMYERGGTEHFVRHRTNRQTDRQTDMLAFYIRLR